MCAWTGLILPLYDLFVKINKTLHCLSTDSSFFFLKNSHFLSHLLNQRDVQRVCDLLFFVFFCHWGTRSCPTIIRFCGKGTTHMASDLDFLTVNTHRFFFNQKSKNLNIVFTNITKHISKTEQIQKRKKKEKKKTK